jgi:hypothetical protein
MNYEDLRQKVLADLTAQGLTMADLREAYVEEMEASPEWQIIYPRVYTGVGGYGSPKKVAETYYTALHWVKDNPNSSPAAMQAIYGAACMAKRYNFPLFFVDENLLAAVVNTEPPSGVRWAEMKLPFEAGAISLPRGALRYIDGTDVNHLGWCRVRKGDEMRFDDRSLPIKAPDDCFITYAQPLNEEGTVLFSSLDGTSKPYIDACVLEERWHAFFDLPFAAGDEEFLRLTRSLVFGLLMVINARPALVSKGRREGKQSKGNKREFWTPNVIGRDYHAQREHQGGSHGSPRGGWRRGHYTHVAFGSIKNNPDFVSAASLPRAYNEATATWHIDWDKVDDETRVRFWENHYHHWLEPIWVDGEAG